MINKQTKDNVNLCFNFYEVDADEAKFEIARIKANLKEAEKCYSIIAAKIRSGKNRSKTEN